MRAFFNYADSLTKYLLFSLLSVMLVSAFMQVLFRYVIRSSLSWSDELIRYLFIWLIFIGVSFSIRRNGHIAIESVYLLLKDHQKVFYRKIIYFIQILF